MKFKHFVLVLLAAALVVPTGAFGEKKKGGGKPKPTPTAGAKKPDPCRGHPNIIASAASLAKNLELGGHVYRHVKGQTTEKDKSQFESEAAFKAAFTAFSKLKDFKNPTTCGTKGGPHDCVAAADVGITTAVVCKQVDAKGKCTSEEQIAPKAVGFWYLTKAGKPDKKGDGGTNGKWILRTAYPSVNANCS